MTASVRAMQLTLCTAIMQVTTSAAIMQVLRFYHNYVGDCFCWNYAVKSFCRTCVGNSSAANVWVTIFILIMQVEVSVAIMHVELSAVNYSHVCFYLIMQVNVSVIGKFQLTVLYSFFRHLCFVKLTTKHLKAIYQVFMSSLF